MCAGKDAISVVGYHPDPDVNLALLADSLSTGDLVFAARVLRDLSSLALKGKELPADELNGALSLVRAIGPRDPTAALLATQMAVIASARGANAGPRR
jgi:hypothetical protein